MGGQASGLSRVLLPRVVPEASSFSVELNASRRTTNSAWLVAQRRAAERCCVLRASAASVELATTSPRHVWLPVLLNSISLQRKYMRLAHQGNVKEVEQCASCRKTNRHSYVG